MAILRYYPQSKCTRVHIANSSSEGNVLLLAGCSTLMDFMGLLLSRYLSSKHIYMHMYNGSEGDANVLIDKSKNTVYAHNARAYNGIH